MWLRPPDGTGLGPVCIFHPTLTLCTHCPPTMCASMHPRSNTALAIFHLTLPGRVGPSWSRIHAPEDSFSAYSHHMTMCPCFSDYLQATCNTDTHVLAYRLKSPHYSLLAAYQDSFSSCSSCMTLCPPCWLLAIGRLHACNQHTRCHRLQNMKTESQAAANNHATTTHS